jgi:hypothetical protein
MIESNGELMPTGTVVDPSNEDGLFEVRAVEVMRGLRASFLGLIESLPGAVHRAADLERALGVGTTLAWQVHRVATTPNPLAAGADVPGMAATRQVLRAARSKGVPDQCLRSVTQAMETFESLVERHAGDRATFGTMINSLAGRSAEAIDVKMRRQAFRVSSQMWGVQGKTYLRCTLCHPGKTSSMLDIASIRGMRDIRRLRASAAFRLVGHRVRDAHKHIMAPHAVGDESPQSPPGPNLLLDFCTQPCPEMENRLEDGYVASYLRDTPLGNAGVRTLYLADVSRDIEWCVPGEPPYLENTVASWTPAEVLVLDTLIHRDMFGPLTPQLRVFGSLHRLGELDPAKFRPEEALPIPAEVHNLGAGVQVLPTSHVPRYAEMVESVCRRVGWDPNAFEVFRCIIEYPMLSSVVVVRFDLPEKGNW